MDLFDYDNRGINEMTEDQVRDAAKITLGFDDGEKNVEQGTGQLTTLNTISKIDFTGVQDKPDGWYLPKDKGKVAIIMEAKGSDKNIADKKWINEIKKNCEIVGKVYSKVVGILWNGKDIKVFKNNEEIADVSSTLEHKGYYLKLFTNEKIDKNLIYNVTMRINNLLHFSFGMQDLQERMIFTACALVAQRFNPKNGLQTLKGKEYSIFQTWISKEIGKAIANDKRQNFKLEVLLEEYDAVRMSITEDQSAINSFIDNVCEIAELVNSDNWNGEDVMAIFFNEFNRYRGKADAGQVFTPDHITSFMYRLIDVNMNDKILDATCGSGAFLVKAMCNMIKEAGGVNSNKAKKIKQNQLFGIDKYRKMFALACANMLIHKDGKTNLAQMDAITGEAGEWIKKQGITKVLMNPPYERKNKCMDIVDNVLKHVPSGTLCAFILPDKKLEKDTKGRKLLKEHTLKIIVKMPENLFFGIGITTSIFVFEAGKPQGDKDIIGYYIEDDGLETVKNKGRQDIKNKWDAIEDYWITSIRNGEDKKYNTKQIIHPAEHLSYQMPEKPFEICEEDFIKTMMDYEMFKQGIDVKEFGDKLLNKVLYGSRVDSKSGTIIITSDGDKNGIN